MILILNTDKKINKDANTIEKDYNEKVVKLIPNLSEVNYEEELNVYNEWTRPKPNNIKPLCLNFEGINFEVSDWVDIYEVVIEYIAYKYGLSNMPENILKEGNTRNSYIYSLSKNINKVFSANEIRDKVVNILTSYKLNVDFLKVYTMRVHS